MVNGPGRCSQDIQPRAPISTRIDIEHTYSVDLGGTVSCVHGRGVWGSRLRVLPIR